MCKPHDKKRKSGKPVTRSKDLEAFLDGQPDQLILLLVLLSALYALIDPSHPILLIRSLKSKTRMSTDIS